MSRTDTGSDETDSPSVRPDLKEESLSNQLGDRRWIPDTLIINHSDEDEWSPKRPDSVLTGTENSSR